MFVTQRAVKVFGYIGINECSQKVCYCCFFRFLEQMTNLSWEYGVQAVRQILHFSKRTFVISSATTKLAESLYDIVFVEGVKSSKKTRKGTLALLKQHIIKVQSHLDL